MNPLRSQMLAIVLCLLALPACLAGDAYPGEAVGEPSLLGEAHLPPAPDTASGKPVMHQDITPPDRAVLVGMESGAETLNWSASTAIEDMAGPESEYVADQHDKYSTAAARRGGAAVTGNENTDEDDGADRRGLRLRKRPRQAAGPEMPAARKELPGPPPVPYYPEPARTPPAYEFDQEGTPEAWQREYAALPTRDEVEAYRMRLQDRLLERYNNLPEHAGNVARVSVVLSKPLKESLDGSLIRAEFDQLVYDPWGKRIPELEQEYFVVTFGTGGSRQVRSDPSIRVGLDMEKTYSERAPLAADPFKNAPDSDAFQPAPKAKMPEWWRPDFPEVK